MICSTTGTTDNLNPKLIDGDLKMMLPFPSQKQRMEGIDILTYLELFFRKEVVAECGGEEMSLEGS